MCHVSLRFAVTRINILFLGDGERETCARATRTAAADDRREPRDPQTTTRRPRSRTTRDAHARARPPPADAAHARRERGRERPRPTATADCARTDDVDLEAHVWLACHTTSARDPGRGRARGCAARGGRRARGRATRRTSGPRPRVRPRAARAAAAARCGAGSRSTADREEAREARAQRAHRGGDGRGPQRHRRVVRVRHSPPRPASNGRDPRELVRRLPQATRGHKQQQRGGAER